MSDRRPENRLVVTVATGGRHSVSPTELLAAIRAGVESGTIKGEVVEVTGDEIETDPVWLEQGQWLCIRLDKERPSDGGSET